MSKPKDKTREPRKPMPNPETIRRRPGARQGAIVGEMPDRPETIERRIES